MQVKLNLYGNTLTGIKVDDRLLAAGADYMISGDQLTLKAEFLRGHVPEALSESVTLTCTFSVSADWKLYVIRYDHPTVRKAIGTKSMFFIPVHRRGLMIRFTPWRRCQPRMKKRRSRTRRQGRFIGQRASHCLLLQEAPFTRSSEKDRSQQGTGPIPYEALMSCSFFVQKNQI
ncbi:hypothetical protein KP806_27175 [Paenibacillus sp. N4]|nr:hypothetical protein [Paenibacillus vietnamensis]